MRRLYTHAPSPPPQTAAATAAVVSSVVHAPAEPAAAEVPSVGSLQRLRVAELQAQLQQLGLPKKGLKEELVQRLYSALQSGHPDPPQAQAMAASAAGELSQLSPPQAAVEPAVSKRTRKAKAKPAGGGELSTEGASSSGAAAAAVATAVEQAAPVSRGDGNPKVFSITSLNGHEGPEPEPAAAKGKRRRGRAADEGGSGEALQDGQPSVAETLAWADGASLPVAKVKRPLVREESRPDSRDEQAGPGVGSGETLSGATQAPLAAARRKKSSSSSSRGNSGDDGGSVEGNGSAAVKGRKSSSEKSRSGVQRGQPGPGAEAAELVTSVLEEPPLAAEEEPAAGAPRRKKSSPGSPSSPSSNSSPSSSSNGAAAAAHVDGANGAGAFAAAASDGGKRADRAKATIPSQTLDELMAGIVSKVKAKATVAASPDSPSLDAPSVARPRTAPTAAPQQQQRRWERADGPAAEAEARRRAGRERGSTAVAWGAASEPLDEDQPRPISGHPQVDKFVSWRGHRPAHYSSYGLATDVVFDDRPDLAARPPPAPPLDQLFPVMVGKHGEYLGNAPEPLSSSRWTGAGQEQPEGLPPMPLVYRNESYGSYELKGSMEEKETYVVANTSGLNLSFMGTSSNQSTRHRAQPSVALIRAKDVIVIDAGDDTQRQMAALSTARPHKVYRILITCLSADCVLGLPGLLCTISAARERGHEDADIPIHLYGPPGLTDFVDTMLKVSNTYLEVSILVHEFTMSATIEQPEPVAVNKRSRLWSVLVPPDQLNPKGAFNGNLADFMPTQGRATISKGLGAKGGVLVSDPRVNFLPFEEPVPGNPSRTDVAPLDMRWTVVMDREAKVTAVPLQAPRPTLAYIFREADRTGNLLLDRAQAFGVPKGASYGMLKEGQPIVTPSGRLVTPEMVTLPRRLGRKVIVLGTCSDASTLLRHDEALAADVLVAGALRPGGEDANVGRGGDEDDAALVARVPSAVELMTAGRLGGLAAALSARHVLLSRFDWRLHGSDTHPWEDPLVGRMVGQVAARLAPEQRVTAVQDLFVHVLEKHDGIAFAKDREEGRKEVAGQGARAAGVLAEVE